MLPYNQIKEISQDVRYVKQVRLLRGLTLKDMEEIMQVDFSTISKIENGTLQFTPLYQSYFEAGCRKLRISNIEIDSLRKVIQIKEERGIKL